MIAAMVVDMVTPMVSMEIMLLRHQSAAVSVTELLLYYYPPHSCDRHILRNSSGSYGYNNS